MLAGLAPALITMEKGGGIGMRKLAVFVAAVVTVLITAAVFADEQVQLITDLGNWSIWAIKTSNGRAVLAMQNTATFYVNDTAYSIAYGVGIARTLANHMLAVLIPQLGEQTTSRIEVRPVSNNGNVLCKVTYIGWDDSPISSNWRTVYYSYEKNVLLINLDPLLYSMEAVLSKELRISFETNVGQVTVVVDISNIYRVLTELDLASVGL
jgi:hypothetical protein